MEIITTDVHTHAVIDMEIRQGRARASHASPHTKIMIHQTCAAAASAARVCVYVAVCTVQSIYLESIGAGAGVVEWWGSRRGEKKGSRKAGHTPLLIGTVRQESS